MILSSLNLVKKIGVCITSEENGESKFTSEEIVIYIISGIKVILQDSSVKIADDEGVSPSSSVTHEFPVIYFSPRVMYNILSTAANY
jgi:hypothetical protein